MCGLTGLVAEASAGDLASVVRSMSATLAHRGPDDTGEWIDSAHGVAFGFRRLAILDLSPAGHQPMTSASGRYVAMLNGEIYNFEELRRTLADSGAAPPFRGHSDTEVMLAAFDAWGLDAVRRFNGMFAIALWDCEERRLHLIRDRMGVKPLFYATAGEHFIFGSELKALRQHPRFAATLDPGALHLYFRFLYVPAPFTIYENTRKVMPGTILTFDAATRRTETRTWWSLRDAAEHGVSHRFAGSEEEASCELERLLLDAVRLRLVSDVPLGVFLSGGIDSSLVTALMQRTSSSRVRTFTIGFRDRAYDEAPFARAVAQHLGTEHTEVVLSEEDVVKTIARLPEIYDEPFADSSQIPTFLVAMLARRHVTVALSGDGGDELFGGYHRYFVSQRLVRMIGRMPLALRPRAGRALASLSPDAWDRLLGLMGPIVPRALRQRRSGERIHKIARVLSANDSDSTYFELVSHWSGIVTKGNAPEAPVTDRSMWPPLADPVERMMYLDQMSYLPDDILTKVDRASMAVSLESREPLLDPRLVEFAWTLPPSMKVRGGTGKRILRRVLDRYVPSALIDRPKTGFGIPLETLLRGRLRDWAESLLDAPTLDSHGLDSAAIRAKWKEHLDGRGDWKAHLWGVLMFEAWLRHG